MGQFGSVYLTAPKNKEFLCALKCINKKKVLGESLEKYLIVRAGRLERRI